MSSEDADSQSHISRATSADETMNAGNAIPTDSAVSSTLPCISQSPLFDNKSSQNQQWVGIYPAASVGKTVRFFNPE